jgi:hypothetical protein
VNETGYFSACHILPSILKGNNRSNLDIYG